MKTYEQAVLNQWNIAAHRIAFAKDPDKKTAQCNCDDCKEHLAALKSGPTPEAAL